MRVLGISAFYHDARRPVDEGRIIAAAQEERFTRKRHDAEFPAQAIAYCLEGRLRRSRPRSRCVYDKPFLKFERLLETYVALAPRGFRSFKLAVPVWLREKLFQRACCKRNEKFSDQFDAANKFLFASIMSATPRQLSFPLHLRRLQF